MCGIAGFWNAEGLTDRARPDLDGMIESLHHRGPDGRGRWLDPERGVAFGHARLSIVDLFTGDQPIVSPDGELALIVNGEFYDYKRLRADLMTRGHRFTTRSDSEIALHLYRQHGLDFVEHLRGEFALALWDRPNDRLVLVRDRFGVRPLFVERTPTALRFASEVKGVLAHPDVPVRLCPRATLNQLMHTMVPGSSAFQGVEAVEPGHMLIVTRRDGRLDVERRRYWDLDFPREAERDAGVPAEHHVERIRDELVRAVAFRLEADVPVGCYLSGGIDSCSILGMAAGAQQAPVKAFTIAFDDDAYDESAIAREMAERAGADQDLIRLGAEELYGPTFERTVWHAERTFYNTLGVAKWCMSRHVNQAGYKTVITGEGSDELFAGYPAFKRDMFTHGLDHEPESVRREALAALEDANRLFKGAILSEDREGHPAFEALCGFTPSWLQPWIATLRLARPLLHPALREELHDYDPVAAIAAKIDPAMLEDRHPLDRAQYTWAKTMLEGQILNWGGDRVDMANSMESRPAFLDHHVAEAAVHVPPSLRIKGSTEKWVLREAVRGVLPDVLYRRMKFAFMAPPAHTDEAKRARVVALIDRHLGDDAVRGAGLLDAEATACFVAGWKADDDPVSLTRKDALLNHLLCLQILHDQYVAGNAPPRLEPPLATRTEV